MLRSLVLHGLSLQMNAVIFAGMDVRHTAAAPHRLSFPDKGKVSAPLALCGSECAMHELHEDLTRRNTHSEDLLRPPTGVVQTDDFLP